MSTENMKKASTKKLKEAIDLLLNEEDEAANEAMHDYFVGLARKINEEYEDAELAEMDLDYNMDDDIKDEIESDMDEVDAEEGMHEEDEEEFGFGDVEGDLDADDAEDDLEVDMELDAEGDVEDGIEDSIDDIQAALTELRDKLSDVGVVDDMDDMEYDEIEYDDVDTDDEVGNMDYNDDEEVKFDDEASTEETYESEEVDEEEHEEELDESVGLEKVATPANKEGQEVGKGPSFKPNTTQVTKPKGAFKSSNGKPNMSHGGEHTGYAREKAEVPAELDDSSDNMLGRAKTAQKKAPAPETKEKDVGPGKDSLLSKKVR